MSGSLDNLSAAEGKRLLTPNTEETVPQRSWKVKVGKINRKITVKKTIRFKLYLSGTSRMFYKSDNYMSAGTQRPSQMLLNRVPNGESFLVYKQRIVSFLSFIIKSDYLPA